MNARAKWLQDLNATSNAPALNGLVLVRGYRDATFAPEQRVVMEKAESYGAHSVFFEASRNGRPPVAQAFVYVSDGSTTDEQFADLHKRLWSWGGVPLVYRKTAGLVQLFRCAHRPDFELNGRIVLRPFKILHLASEIASEVDGDPWWDADRLRNGTLWDDPQVCKQLLSNQLAAQKTLISAVRDLHEDLDGRSILPKAVRRRLLILSILIAYLEARGVFEDDFFTQFKRKATNFFQVLSDGPALLKLLDHLEERFNGNVFVLKSDERETLRKSSQLQRFAQLVEGRQEQGGQLTLWQRYSFADLPVELISHIYQLFVKDSAVEVYTPHFVVQLMLAEVLSWERLDRVEENDEVILDGACGSGIFLVEAYKRLVLHWRYRNNWKRATRPVLTRLLTARVRGIDKEEGAVELAAFSLCLALCDALEPKEIRTSIKLFPPLKEQTIHTSCFFEALERQTVAGKIGVVIGNPPFTSKLGTDGAQRAYDRYQKDHGALPDKQLAYLFLHEPMQKLVPGGVLCMLQQYNFLYNQQSLGFRRKFIEQWDVREVLDFISVRGLFHKGDADTKVVVVVAEAGPPPQNREILHATFRRTGRTDAEQGFDIDYYDMHWVPRELALKNDSIWRANLLGGGRLLAFVDRMKSYRTLEQLGFESKWNIGEGWVFGGAQKARPADHVVGKKYVEASALDDGVLAPSGFARVPDRPIERPRRAAIFTPPLLLIHKHEDLSFGTWEDSYLTYRHTIVGISAAAGDKTALKKAASWLKTQKLALQAILASSGTAALASKATAVLSDDILQLPFPEKWNLDITAHEQILIADIVDYYRDLVRLGEDSVAMKQSADATLLTSFSDTFAHQVNGIYHSNPLRPLAAQRWPGVICQPYIFGDGTVDWTGAEALKGRIDALLRERRDGALNVTRIARIYDGPCIYLVKPDRLRYWLRSVALRDADETLADLVAQGY